MTESQHEHIFQAAMDWLDLVGVPNAAVHVAIDTGDRFVVLTGDKVVDIEEAIPNFFNNCTMKVMGAEVDSGEPIYHVTLPAEYQGVI